MGFIYSITSPCGKQYIGQTKRKCNKRWNEHTKCEGKSIAIESAINKYGKDNMKFEILLEINNELLDQYESKFIKLYNTISPNGYNLREGGNGTVFCKETLQKMSESKKGVKNHNYGIPRTSDTKQKISESKKGIKHHFYNKELSENHKLKLSASHKKYDNSLPMYIAYIKERPEYYQSNGYAVTNHPYLKNKHFTSKKITLEEKLILAIEYLNSSTNAVQRLNGDGSSEN